MPNTDYTDYTDNWVVFIIWTDNVTLSVQRRYLLTYSSDIVLLYSLGCIHPIPTCRTLITLVTVSFFTICTNNVNAICPTTISSKIQLWYCIAVFPRLYQNTTYSIFQNQGTPSCLGAASSCLVWPRLALPCHALSCLVLSCLGLNVTLFRPI